MVQLKSAFIVLAAAILSSTSFVWAQGTAPQTEQPTLISHLDGGDENQGAAPTAEAGQQSPGSIRGTIVDQSGAVVPGAQVKLTGGDQKVLSAVSGTDGEFFFPKVLPGAFQLAITSAGFDPQTFSGTLRAGEVETLPQIAINVAETRIEVQVGLSQVEVATE